MSKQHEPGNAMDQEWEAQERAFQEERARDASAEADARPGGSALVRTYRVLARYLRQPIEEGLGPDFAADIARIARKRHDASTQASMESRVVRAVGLIFAAAAVGFSLVDGAAWLALVDFDSTGVQWLLAAAGCVALTTLLPARARRNRAR